MNSSNAEFARKARLLEAYSLQNHRKFWLPTRDTTRPSFLSAEQLRELQTAVGTFTEFHVSKGRFDPVGKMPDIVSSVTAFVLRFADHRLSLSGHELELATCAESWVRTIFAPEDPTPVLLAVSGKASTRGRTLLAGIVNSDALLLERSADLTSEIHLLPRDTARIIQDLVHSGDLVVAHERKVADGYEGEGPLADSVALLELDPYPTHLWETAVGIWHPEGLWNPLGASPLTSLAEALQAAELV